MGALVLPLARTPSFGSFFAIALPGRRSQLPRALGAALAPAQERLQGRRGPSPPCWGSADLPPNTSELCCGCSSLLHAPLAPVRLSAERGKGASASRKEGSQSALLSSL